MTGTAAPTAITGTAIASTTTRRGHTQADVTGRTEMSLRRSMPYSVLKAVPNGHRRIVGRIAARRATDIAAIGLGTNAAATSSARRAIVIRARIGLIAPAKIDRRVTPISHARSTHTPDAAKKTPALLNAGMAISPAIAVRPGAAAPTRRSS